jgi:hypothetical protein
MTPEQKQRLETLRDDLLETAVLDADPRRWVGAGKAPVDMTQKERGDAYWCRKMAAATVSLLARVSNIVNTHSTPSAGTPKDEVELDGELAAAESEAQAIIDRMQKAGNVH